MQSLYNHVMVPGLGGSEADHWQSWLEAATGFFRRIQIEDWKDAALEKWIEAIGRQAGLSEQPSLIVAHSFGCLAAAEFAQRFPHLVAGLLLVAPADPAPFQLGEALSFKPLPVPALLVASQDDPWMPVHLAHRWAEIWGAEYIDAGRAGHINVASGYGRWPAVLAHLERLKSLAGFSQERSRPRTSSM